MSDNPTIIRRPLPPELLCEMHRCLPLADAINLLVNVPSRAIAKNNGPRMRRVVQQIKSSLREYLRTLVYDDEDDEEMEDEEISFENEFEAYLEIEKNVQWKPEFDTLIRYGGEFTPIERISIEEDKNYYLNGVPENFAKDLLLFLANSNSTGMMLESIGINLKDAKFPAFMDCLIDKKDEYLVGGRILYQGIKMEADNGQTLFIHDGEFGNDLMLHIVNKVVQQWFEVRIDVNEFSKNVSRLEFRVIPSMERLGEIGTNLVESNHLKNIGDKVKANCDICWCLQWDAFLRRGANHTRFRHFEISHGSKMYDCPDYYAEDLICYLADTPCPEDVLETIDLGLDPQDTSTVLHQIWNACRKGIQKGGKLIKFGDKKMRILSGETEVPEQEWPDGLGGYAIYMGDYRLEFTVANGPTNGLYEFDVDVKFSKEEGPDKIVGIQIEKRKNNAREKETRKRISDEQQKKPMSSHSNAKDDDLEEMKKAKTEE